MTQEDVNLLQKLNYCWERLTKMEPDNSNGEPVIRREAAERMAAGLGIRNKSIGKSKINKQEFLWMYMPDATYRAIYESKQDKNPLTITIDWNVPISVKDIDDCSFTKIEEDIVNTENVIYIFVGYNNKGEKAQDVGQTGRTLIARAKEHIKHKDFLERYPNNRRVYCGEVSCEGKVNRALLEQVEGAIIQYLKEDNGKCHLCNENKLESYARTYVIGSIENRNMTEELERMLPKKFIPRSED